jgi:hypothetical protein
MLAYSAHSPTTKYFFCRLREAVIMIQFDDGFGS